MGPKPSQSQTAELFLPRLDEQINMKHPLVRSSTNLPALENGIVQGGLKKPPVPPASR